MELKERLKSIMEQEFGITTEAQLNDAIGGLDLSIYSIFTAQNGREKRYEKKGDMYFFADSGNSVNGTQRERRAAQ